MIEERGLWESTWVHFDFGCRLRKIVAGELPDASIRGEDVALIGRLLETGGLLEHEHFPLAEQILRSFLAERAADRQTCVVLNGLPRHLDQANAVEAIVDISTVISLRCTQETVLRRVFSDVGGDRRERFDDNPELVVARLIQFHERTAPLLQHYRSIDVPVRQIVVTAAMTADEIWRILQRRGG